MLHTAYRVCAHLFGVVVISPLFAPLVGYGLPDGTEPDNLALNNLTLSLNNLTLSLQIAFADVCALLVSPVFHATGQMNDFSQEIDERDRAVADIETAMCVAAHSNSSRLPNNKQQTP